MFWDEGEFQISFDEIQEELALIRLIASSHFKGVFPLIVVVSSSTILASSDHLSCKCCA